MSPQMVRVNWVLSADSFVQTVGYVTCPQQHRIRTSGSHSAGVALVVGSGKGEGMQRRRRVEPCSRRES